jgi:hypothetical protein
MVRKTSKAARAVSTHFRFSSIGVKIAHSEIGMVRWLFQQQNSICSDPAMAITKTRDLATI